MKSNDQRTGAVMRTMVSAVVIAKNEEKNLPGCLESLRWVDELIVVDSESADRTMEIAREYTDKVFVRPWCGFPSQRNFGIGNSSGDWIVILDADERFLTQTRDEILAWLGSEEAKEYVAGYFPRRNFVFGKWLRYGGIYPDLQCRLLRKGKVTYDENSLDTPLINGPRKVFCNPVDHFTGDHVGGRVIKVIRQSQFKAQEKLSKRRRVRWRDVMFRPIMAFVKMYLLKQGYRDGIEGFIYATLSSLHTFLCYAKMWEILSQESLDAEMQGCRKYPSRDVS